ncbi:MAG: 30S ribosomal protein S20 [Anaerolineales bacterium]|nr:30S ribosomal protein S20 [Anaerolineales bacterium]
MANIQSAKKRIRQNEKRRLHNRAFIGGARTYIRKARTAMAGGNVEEARALTHNAVKALDKAASKGIIHKNNASRRKSRLMAQLAQLEKEKAN